MRFAGDGSAPTCIRVALLLHSQVQGFHQLLGRVLGFIRVHFIPELCRIPIPDPNKCMSVSDGGTARSESHALTFQTIMRIQQVGT